MTAADVGFTVVALVAVAAAVRAVTSRQVVHAALHLVLCLGAVAVGYLVLAAPVVALVQLLVYVGAVVVLVLFALMLTRAPIGVRDDLDAAPARRTVAAVAGVAVGALLGGVLLAAVGSRTVTPDVAPGRVAAIGHAVFTGWVLPFELLSVLLLAALVAAIALARADRGSPPERERLGVRHGEDRP